MSGNKTKLSITKIRSPGRNWVGVGAAAGLHPCMESMGDQLTAPVTSSQTFRVFLQLVLEVPESSKLFSKDSESRLEELVTFSQERAWSWAGGKDLGRLRGVGSDQSVLYESNFCN